MPVFETDGDDGGGGGAAADWAHRPKGADEPDAGVSDLWAHQRNEVVCAQETR